MNKKLFLLGFVLTAMPTNPVMGDDGLFQSGFYTGLSAGYSRGSVGVSDSRFNNDAAFLTSVWNKKSTGSRGGINGDIGLGYRHFLKDRYAIGFSTTLGLDNNNVSKSHLSPNNTAVFKQETITRLKTSYKITPTVVLGARVSDTLLLTTELGVGIRRFKLNHSFDITTDPDPALVESFSKTKAGFSGKLVLERAITSNISLSGSLGYEYYGTFQKNLQDTIGAPVERNTVKITPSYVTTNVGVIYRF